MAQQSREGSVQSPMETHSLATENKWLAFSRKFDRKLLWLADNNAYEKVLHKIPWQIWNISFEMLIKEGPEASTIKVLVIPVGCLIELSDRTLLKMPSPNLVTRYSETKWPWPESVFPAGSHCSRNWHANFGGSGVLMILLNWRYYELQY